MYKAKINKYKEIYNKRVLPKKTVTHNTPEIYTKTMEVLEEFSIYRNRANEVLLGGKVDGEKQNKP